MRRLGSIVMLLAGAASWGCSPHDAPPPGDGGIKDTGPDALFACGIDYLGDAANPIEMQVIALGPGGMSSDVQDGTVLPLIFPPQGGRVLFTGVRATNLDPCAVKLSGAVRDPATQEVRVDIRTVNLHPVDGGWGSSTDTDISSFANVPICPNQWSSTDAYGNPYDLVVAVTDRAGRTSSQTLHVTMTCAEPTRLAECLCICKAGYILGETCPTDAGGQDAAEAGGDEAGGDGGGGDGAGDGGGE